MDQEIKRNGWSRFCKKFNTANQYRRTQLTVRRRNEDTRSLIMSPFMGIAMRKDGRVIDAIEFYVGRSNPDKIAEPMLVLANPEKIWVQATMDGRDGRLHITAKDGTEVRLELSGEPEAQQARALVEKVAYGIFQHRGQTPGNDWSDWFEAEQKVRQAELELTE